MAAVSRHISLLQNFPRVVSQTKGRGTAGRFHRELVAIEFAHFVYDLRQLRKIHGPTRSAYRPILIVRLHGTGFHLVSE